MTGRVVLLDSVVPLLAFGAVHPQQPECQSVLLDPGRHGWVLTGSTELIQEFAFHRLRRFSPAEVAQDSRSLQAMVTMLDFDIRVVDEMLDLIEHHAVRGRDAVHAATARVHGISTIVSTDAAFDAVPGLERIDPSTL